MRRILLALPALVSALALAACSSSSPTAPSATAGITLNGSIVAPGSGSGSTASVASWSESPASIPPGLTVGVRGTGITTAVNASGQFSLSNLPAGNVELAFTAPGVSAALGLTNLQPGETISIAVSLTSSAAVLETERRSTGREEQVEGRIESLPPDVAALTFIVAGRTVTTDANTRFLLRNGPVGFDALEVGFRVHVKGQTVGGTLLASLVDIQNTNGTAVNINGVIEDMSGTPSAFLIVVDGQEIHGDSLTQFFGGTVFADLAIGQTVEVKGLQRTGHVYATRIHVEAEEVEFSGTILAPIAGTSPDLQFTVASTPNRQVNTTAATIVRRKSDTQTPAALQVGMLVSVTGRALPGGAVNARRISIEGDEVGGLFEMTGRIGGLSGACPTVSFSIAGSQIATTALTSFLPAAPGCSGLSNGHTVTVKGTVLAGGSIEATEVRKQ